ncbi:MAG: alginate export family protein, partial [Deltaproteobacteria bacterium]|nr:alginate export family protein [Deltaproteobacteria bacterium]
MRAALSMLVLMLLAPVASAQPASQPTSQPMETAPPKHETPPPVVAAPAPLPPKTIAVAPAATPAAPKAQLLLPGGVTLTPHLQYRARFLFRDNTAHVSSPITEAVTHRARIGLDVRIAESFRLFVQVQDVRTWGEEANTLGDYSGNGIDFHQAFAEANCPLGLMLRVGRQEIALDNQRLMGAVGWTDQARAFDGVRLGYQRDALAAHAFWAKVTEGDVIDGDGNALPGRDLAGLWVRYTGLAFLRPSFLFVFDRDSALGRERFTTGLFLDGTLMPGLSYMAEFYYQGGTIDAGAADITISAMLAALRVGYTAPVWGKPRVEAFFDYLSGDDDPADDKSQSFDTLFATNHKFYGFMDAFLNIPAHTGGLGLMDMGGRA